MTVAMLIDILSTLICGVSTLKDELYWHGLNLIPHIGASRLKQLVETFGSAKAVWHANPVQLEQHEIPAKISHALRDHRPKINLEQESKRLEALRCRIVTQTHTDYPNGLAQHADAPALLYVRGHYHTFDEKALAIVGTRRATRYGRDATKHIARELAKHGVTIISGTAEGVDTYAHEGALEAGGRSIAVLGNGIDVIYPRHQGALLERIEEAGVIVTEFAPTTPPHRSNFPRRNRIISGMALGVLVVEAPERSGALITASIALEQGRDVFAIPSNIFNPYGKGCNRLIQDGAKLIMDVEDILTELNITYEQNVTQASMVEIVPDNENEASIINLLSTDPIHIDDIIRRSGLPAHDVSAILMMLELKGVAQVNGSMQYSRVIQ
jgi:DNA processing protein